MTHESMVDVHSMHPLGSNSLPAFHHKFSLFRHFNIDQGARREGGGIFATEAVLANVMLRKIDNVVWEGFWFGVVS